MKFTQSEAFKKIKGILTRGGKDLQMSERSIMEQIDSLTALIATDDMELDDFVSKVENTFKTMNNNAKKDISDFVNKWKEEHPETDPNKPAGEQKGEDKGEGNTEIAALRQQVEELLKKQTEQDREAKVAATRKSLRDKLVEKGIKDEKWINGLLGEITISEDTDVEAKADAYLALYNKSNADVPANVTPGSVTTGGSTKKSSVELAAEMAKQASASRAAQTNNY